MTENPFQPDTDQLLDQALGGDERAVERLMSRHRDRLQRMIRWRMAPELGQRMDSSDVVQEAILTAYQRLPDYCEQRPVPFFLWLRQIAMDRLVDLHRAHVVADKRSIRREEPPVSGESAIHLVEQLVTGESGPLSRLVRGELSRRASQALQQLSESDRQILILRYLEELNTQEAAAVLGISMPAAKMRHLRALRRLKKLLEDPSQGPNDEPS